MDAPNTINRTAGWVEATSAAVESLTLFAVHGDAPLLMRVQDAAPADDDDLRFGIKWEPGQAVADWSLPGGAATRVWVWAAWGEASYYIKHA
ncbi:MAG: hypothetical protein AAGH68_08900 [Pseudomonadota bacterium]